MSSYVVVRLIPDAPVDGGTFGTYLRDLTITVYPANDPNGTPLGKISTVGSELMFAEIPWSPGDYSALVTANVKEATVQSGGKFGTTLVLDSAKGIPFGSTVIDPSNTNAVDPTSNTIVNNIAAVAGSTETVTVNQGIQQAIVAGEAVSFYFTYPPSGVASINVDWSANQPTFSFALNPNAPSSNSKTVQFASTNGVAVGMLVTATGVPANTTTTVTAVSATEVKLDNDVTLNPSDAVTFTYNLSSGVVQHTEPLPNAPSNLYIPISASVATALIPISPQPPGYLDITVVATQGTITLPVESAYYNVLVYNPTTPLTPDQYQVIAPEQTSLYLRLSAPKSDAIGLIIPTDGSAPPFGDGTTPGGLLWAMKEAVTNDLTFFGADIDLSKLTPPQCTRMAYDIVWSQQNQLPPAPDPLESLYTIPPASGGSTKSGGGTNNLEQDRLKFEGTLNSFYATRDGTAERLTKFVAAASAALYCEQTSANSTNALLEFPVDPTLSLAESVNNELLLQGVGLFGTSGLVFGVPAAFFYAIGVSLDKSATPKQRFQHATGDTVERLLHVFSAAEQAGSIVDNESFQAAGVSAKTTADCPQGTDLLTFGATGGMQSGMTVSGLNIPAGTTVQTVTTTTVKLSGSVPADVKSGSLITFVIPGSIRSFQAARRLVALGISAASNSPSEQVYAGTPIAQLVAGWLSQIDPTPGSALNPPPTYEDKNFTIWSQTLSASDPTGYLFLDLDTLTQSYVIDEFTHSPSQAAAINSPTLDFQGAGLGIAPNMPVTGTGIASGTLVKKIDTVTTVTLTAPGIKGPGVTTATEITFSFGGLTLKATPSVNAAAGTTLIFQGTPVVEAILAGAKVTGASIAEGTTVVSSVSTTTVTLTSVTTGTVATTDVVTFNAPVADVVLATTADCPSGTVLTFADASGVVPGMSAYGINIQPGTAVESTIATTVTLHDAVWGDVPKGTQVMFVKLVNIPTSLSDQIAAWLPTTTKPPGASPTVETLKQVTASQWTSFFTYIGNPSWLPPFTRPVAPGAASVPVSHKDGYVALRIRAFIRAVQQFFSVSTVATAAQLPATDPSPLFDLPGQANDFILKAVEKLSSLQHPQFTFGTAISPSDLGTAVKDVFTDDPAAQAWLVQAITAINDLFTVASAVPEVTGVTLPNQVSLRFSVAEALYARGFRSASDISRLSVPDFQQALTGTIAYDYATALHTKAEMLAHMPTPGGSGDEGNFQPINPDGSLMNCVPPPCLSPTGPIAYLQELLNLSQDSTCENPFVAPAEGQSTLGRAVSARRGPLGILLASCANLETPLPAIDIVNECLEYLGTAPATVSGCVYDTSEDELAGYALCNDADREKKDHDCHDPVAIYAALPEYSTPATPVPASSTAGSTKEAVEPLVYNNLKADFSSCDLPYSQALDVSRTYLHHLGSCRFEEMRTFRKCITEFALDPTKPPVGFQSFLWRYPVRIDTAIEYLGITPEEYVTLFQGSVPQPCAQQTGEANPGQREQAPAEQGAVLQVVGLSPGQATEISDSGVIPLPEFLKITCLSYCEFVELSKSGFPMALGTRHGNANAHDDRQSSVPDCEPCCLGDYEIRLPGDGRQTVVLQLMVFIRLWRKLKCLCGAEYTFAQLFDICKVLQLFNGSAINPEFIRQLAAFQMLRDQFHLPLCDPKAETPGATGADRMPLLALWVGSGAKKWNWNWAKHHLLEGVEKHARSRYGCPREREEQIAHMADNLDALSRLAGFNPPTTIDPSTDVWNSNPGSTLRFAEVLAKMCASEFQIGELLYLFNAEPPQYCENPFPMQDADDVLAYPLEVPEDGGHHSLWKLREELLRVEVGDDDCRDLSWSKIVNEFRHHFGYAPPTGQDPLLSLGQHFFPCVLEESGFSVSGKQRQYRTALASTTAWNSPPGSPFQYDSSASAPELWVQLPLGDEAVAAKLGQLPQLNAAEQAAVQDLYFAPRLDLAFVAFLFPDWQSAEINLIQECDEHKRWHWFQRHFALANARRKVIAEHLAKHVAHRTGCRAEDLQSVAGLVISHLFSDENTGTPWDADNREPLGGPPSVMWTPPPAGGAIPALLGLVGTGLLGEYEISNAAAAPAGTAEQVVWRDVRGPMEAFGHERDATNSAVPTVLPPLTLSDTTNPLVAVTNGYAVKTSDGHRLGGAEPISVKWSGVLLVEHEGEYRFHAGAPTPEGERPDFELAEKSQWRVTLQRGSKVFAVLNHEWPGNTEPEIHEPRLRRGAYQIVVEYSQPAPDFSTAYPHNKRTGFQVKYAGPDSEDCLVTLPVHRLYRDHQDQTLDQGIPFLAGSKNAQAFLKALYTSTLRDMRRTYQRAFKAVLFAGKFGLSARREEHQSELGYMLTNGASFAGYAYHRTATSTFTQHLVNFDFNFLPVNDNYDPPGADGRSAPSLQQTQAMFDWWERLFDYTVVRRQAHRRCSGPLWQMFEEALVNPPGDPAQLLRHIGAEPNYRGLDLSYYQAQTSAIYSVKDADLQDDRWLVRVWHTDRWVRCLMDHFHAKDISKARPDLWASDDPSAPMPASGVTETGNANLLAFFNDGCFDGHPRRYGNVKRLNDGLRERGRKALVSYLCSANRVPLPWSASTYASKPGDLSDLLLLDVETGICEKASRIEEAITAVQTFIRRSRLGLEPDWEVGREFARMWDSRFCTYRVWEKCKLRELYRENWIEWTERGKARRIEAFRFLESELRCSTLTLAAPGGLDWWEDDVKSLEHAPTLLQKAIPSELEPLTALPDSTTREGLATLGSPEYAAMPTWLAAVPPVSASAGGGGAPGGGSGTPSAPSMTVPELARAAMDGSAQPTSVPLWMESAMKLGTRFVRIAAAGVPQAWSGFEPHHEARRTGCCRECGCDHPMLVDEYYFWLVDTQFYAYTDQTDAQSNPDISFTGSYQFGFQDSYYDLFQQQSAEWQEEDQVPSLLAKWQPNPAVRLAWCRVHNGQFGPQRLSDDFVAISDPADLVFLGRGGDSLYFQVTGSATLPPGYTADPSPPGFRYDLPNDESVGTPQAIKPPPLSTSSLFPGGLFSYPYFVWNDPGARLFPESWFSPSMAVAEALRAHCDFELALKWYKRVFDPLNSDCTWMVCDDDSAGGSIGQGTTGQTPGASGIQPTGTATGVVVGVAGSNEVPPPTGVNVRSPVVTDTNAPVAVAPPAGGGTYSNSMCCDSSKVTDEVARQRAVVLHYCQTLIEWGDALMRRRRSPEAFQQARLIYDTVARIMGRVPQSILLPEPASALSVTDFKAVSPPLNPWLMDLYSLVGDRLGLIRTCYDARRLRNRRPDCDMPYWGDDPLRDGWRMVPETCVEETEWCHRSSPYRFVAQIQKAHEIVGRVRELGAALLGAYEKGDAEALALIHAGQERDMLTLGISIRQDQWRDADWQVQALQQTKDVNQTNLLYYANLYQKDLINDEIQNLNLTTAAMLTRTGANVVSGTGEFFHILPDSNVGAMSSFLTLPTGKKLAFMFDTIARIMQTVADIETTTGSMDLTQAGWTRRSAEWFHQMQTLPIEIQQIELQILGAQRRRDQALQELNNQQRQIEHANEVLDFLSDKFTATDLYLFLRKETAALYRQMYEMAHRAADEAQRAFNFERGQKTRRFIPEEGWDHLRQGLMAGERLDFALRHMEKAYLDENVREYELTKHFSLRYHFPMEFLRIKETGHCEIELPEWMFDLDYPGQFMRRIKNVTLTIPCVTGPYNGVHCRATLLGSRTRIDPRIDRPATRCCSECCAGDDYDACPHDLRVVSSYEAREAIATSSGQNDSGMFELNFRDERYLPFEFQGAVSHWRIELPRENNDFDLDTLSDVIINLSYTSREGGGVLRHAAMEAARKHLPGDGWCFFDVRHEFPDAWQMLRNSRHEKGRDGRLGVRMERKMFPFLPGSDEVSITRIAVLFHVRGAEGDCPEAGDCQCQYERGPECLVLEVLCSDHHRKDHPVHVSCVRSEEWPDLYYGLFETEIGPLRKLENHPGIEVLFPHDAGEVEKVYLLCQYKR
ncbi:Tc toxin subunit A-related protein [Paraburkholderia sediminicola]|uniref:Tc toxin subunit A-related protein n=1 Tax=Paraburkholderia sediminicola TaxID=458836 RepID=UPI0038BBCACA